MNLTNIDPKLTASLFELFIRLGDDSLIMGSRLAEWCGHGPILEEDIALANISLDYLGHATLFLRAAGQIEGRGRDEDALAYRRTEREFKNLQLVEQPNGDFAVSIVKIFLFSSYASVLYKAFADSKFEELSAFSAKALKEVRYHSRHSSEWMVRLGDGTAESHKRVVAAVESLWGFSAEFFESDPVLAQLANSGLIVDIQSLHSDWSKVVNQVLSQATIPLPTEANFRSYGSRSGIHTEHLGHLLAEMQYLPRAFPEARW